jgi:hypothetical protein
MRPSLCQATVIVWMSGSSVKVSQTNARSGTSHSGSFSIRAGATAMAQAVWKRLTMSSSSSSSGADQTMRHWRLSAIMGGGGAGGGGSCCCSGRGLLFAAAAAAILEGGGLESWGKGTIRLSWLSSIPMGRLPAVAGGPSTFRVVEVGFRG